MTKTEFDAALEEFFGTSREKIRELFDFVAQQRRERERCLEMRYRVLGAVVTSLATGAALFAVVAIGKALGLNVAQ